MSKTRPAPIADDAVKSPCTQVWASQIYLDFAPKLLAVTRRQLSGKLRKQIEPEDILQSVFRSFYHRYQDSIEAATTNELWKLLITITLNKIRRQSRYYSAKKRDRILKPLTTDIIELSATPDFREPSACDIITMCDELVWVNQHLDQHQRECLELRLQGWDTKDIAARVQTTERTIRRWLQGIRDLFLFREATLQDPTDKAAGKRKLINLEWPGQIIQSNYRDFVIEQMLGAGSICKAYRAKRIEDQQTVCLKILRQQWRDKPDFQQQLLNEATILQSLAHPAIVPLLGIGQMPNEALFLALKWIDGLSLAKAVSLSTLTKGNIKDILKRLRSIVQEIHALGISHGDLNAGNILIDKENEVWLMDFGFAQSGNDVTRHSDRIRQDWEAFDEMVCKLGEY